MLYQRRTFTVPASSGRDEDRRTMCRTKGHAATDAKGRCLCCGEKIVELPPERTGAHRAQHLDWYARVER